MVYCAFFCWHLITRSLVLIVMALWLKTINNLFLFFFLYVWYLLLLHLKFTQYFSLTVHQQKCWSRKNTEGSKRKCFPKQRFNGICLIFQYFLPEKIAALFNANGLKNPDMTLVATALYCFSFLRGGVYRTGLGLGVTATASYSFKKIYAVPNYMFKIRSVVKLFNQQGECEREEVDLLERMRES